MTPKPHFEFSFASGFEEDTFTGIAEDLRAGGAEVVMKRRPPEGPYAFLEWLIPTALILLIAYLKSFSEERSKTRNHIHHCWTKRKRRVTGFLACCICKEEEE